MTAYGFNEITNAIAKTAAKGELRTLTVPIAEIQKIVNNLPSRNEADDARSWVRVRRHPVFKKSNTAMTNEQLTDYVMDRLDELEAMEATHAQRTTSSTFAQPRKPVQATRTQFIDTIRKQLLPRVWNEVGPQPFAEDLVSRPWAGLSEDTKTYLTEVVYWVIHNAVTSGEFDHDPLAAFVKPKSYKPVHPNPNMHKHILVVRFYTSTSTEKTYDPPLELTFTGKTYQNAAHSIDPQDILEWQPAQMVAANDNK